MSYYSDMRERWPYTNLHDLNLDWIMKTQQAMEEQLTNFVSLNTIKYADPLQWTITTQYAANTIVIDPGTGTAYISVQPVPTGVQLSNTDYWTVVFDLEAFYGSFKEGIATDLGAEDNTPAAIPEGGLFWYKNALYIATVALSAGAKIIPGTNADKITIEAWVKSLNTTLQDVISKDMQELQTQITANHDDINTEIIDRDAADTEIKGLIEEETHSREIAVEEIKKTSSNFYNVVKRDNVDNSGASDVGALINKIIASNHDSYIIYFPTGTYKIETPVIIPDNTTLLGDGAGTVFKQKDNANIEALFIDTHYHDYAEDNHDVGVINITIESIAINGNIYEDYLNNVSKNNSVGNGIEYFGGGVTLNNVLIYNCIDGLISTWNSYYTNLETAKPGEAVFNGVQIKFNQHNGWILKCHDSIISNCIISSNSRESHATYDNMVISNSGNGKFLNCHWYSDYGTKKARRSVSIESTANASEFSNCHIEGAYVPLHVEAENNQFSNCYIYASFGSTGVNLLTGAQTFTNCNLGGQATDDMPEKPDWAGAISFIDNIRNLVFDHCRLINTGLTVKSLANSVLSTYIIRGYNDSLLINNDHIVAPIGDSLSNSNVYDFAGDFSVQSQYYSKNIYNTHGGFTNDPALSVLDITGNTTIYGTRAIINAYTGGTLTISSKQTGDMILIINPSDQSVPLAYQGGTINFSSTYTISPKSICVMYCTDSNTIRAV